MEEVSKQKIDTENKLNQQIFDLKYNLQQSQFRVERFRHNKIHFKFYTDIGSYELFTAVLDYLQPDVQSLNYWGSTVKEHDIVRAMKRGRSRTLSIEEEFFLVLTRLKCAFPIEDFSVRFNMSTSNFSRILFTWFHFLHIKFRALPIWATKQTVEDTCFKDLYPKTSRQGIL